jgi:glycosyltransferase involved in cell wall biosynthesis
MKKPKVCIISLAAYPLLAKKDTEVVGGAELQSVLLARELPKHGFDVSFIVSDVGQQSPEIIDDIKILKAYPANAPTGIRFSTVHLIWRALRQADADIYYGFRGIASIVALYCLLKRKNLVIGIPSDMEVQGNRGKRLNIYNWLWRFDIKRANVVIAQTKYQQEMLQRNFGRDSVIIKAFHPVESKAIEKEMPPIVLWVGTIRPEWKRPEVFLKLAAAIPQARFQMVGGPPREQDFYEQIKAEAAKIPNLDFTGFVPHHEIGKYFEKASILVNTSDVEGFPNTFLEAWSRYTPVVSLNIDPDEIICQNKLGYHPKTFEQMVFDVRRLLGDERLRKELGENGRRYVEQEHDLNRVVEQYAELFNNLINRGR